MSTELAGSNVRLLPIVGAREGMVAPARFLVPIALAALAAAAYLLNLTVSGYANTYYALAAQAASQSWSAWFFGSLDSSGFITIDKPPLATWLLGLSVRVLGLSSWSILLPQALLGVGTVVVLYVAVRRSFGTTAGAIAGVVAALTPAAVLIFRYDNPDALLTFLLVTAAWALGRGLEAGRLRWALLAGALVGAGFLTKYLQAYLVLPVFALAWLVGAPVSLRRRVTGLLASAVVVLVASGWWVAIVELIPASARPYIGGSTNNSVLDLIFGYDGLGRIFGGDAGQGAGPGGAVLGGAGGPGGGGGFGGDPGLFRLFNDQFGGQVAWLLPVAIGAVVIAAVLYRRAARTDRRVGGYVLWGGWLLVHLAVFSFMSGIIHPYYTVVLAPAIGALVGAVAVDLWQRRSFIAARAAGVALVLSGAIVAWLLLERTPSFLPGLGIAILVVAALAAVLLVMPNRPGIIGARRLAPAGALLAAAALLAGPLAYDGVTMASALSGGDPAAGPAVATSVGPGGGFGGFGGDGGLGGFGGPGGVASLDASVLDYLVRNRGDANWIVAVRGSQNAAAIQLATDAPVMSMGGFNGSDPAPTLDQLQSLISSGDLRFVLLGRAQQVGFGLGTTDVDAWVAASCSAVTVDGSTTTNLYDCAAAA